MLTWLQGKKSYFIALAMVVVTGVYGTGYIEEKTYMALMGLLGGGGVAALRAGVSKTGPNA